MLDRQLALGWIYLFVLGTGVAAHAQEAQDSHTDFGVGARVDEQRLSKRVQKYFTGDVPGPASQRHYGIEFVRRRDDMEIVIGFGYGRIDLQDGYYLEKGAEPTTAGKVDYMDFDKLKWFTAEVTVVGNLPLHKLLAVRYGAGLGAGVVRGKVERTDALCTGSDIQNDCAPDPNGMQMNDPANVPPVLPVVNLLVGLQLRPFEALTINIDAGLHSFPYIGASSTLFLW